MITKTRYALYVISAPKSYALELHEIFVHFYLSQQLRSWKVGGWVGEMHRWRKRCSRAGLFLYVAWPGELQECQMIILGLSCHIYFDCYSCKTAWRMSKVSLENQTSLICSLKLCLRNEARSVVLISRGIQCQWLDTLPGSQKRKMRRDVCK